MFAAAHYAALAVFVTGCWGYGRALLGRVAPPPRRDAGLEAAMAVALGVGIFVCAFQALAIFDAFRTGATAAVVAVGVVAAALQLPSWLRERRALLLANPPAPPWSYVERVAAIALALVVLPALVAPLAPPIAFDELMYHLPYARQVAEQGSLGMGFVAVVLPDTVVPVFTARVDFDKYFAVQYQQDGSRVYRILPAAP